MAEPTMADLKLLPSHYQSSRSRFDVLIGPDTALPLIEALDDNTRLQSMLSQQQWTRIALEKPHCIYFQERPSNGKRDLRTVSAMPMLTLERVITIAAEKGHAAAVSTLLNFALEQGIEPSSVISWWAVNTPITNGHVAVFEALASAYPSVVNFDLKHGRRPLAEAIKRRKTEIVAVLLRFGARPAGSYLKDGKFGSLDLYHASRVGDPRMLEMLLEHDVFVAFSGTLHRAARLGALDTMRLLIQNGADVNEHLPRENLPEFPVGDLWASWTPMHFAASGGHLEAMKLLESNGARSDGKDENGKTPTQLLEERKERVSSVP
jgi:ankyrin repeat protein